MGKKTSKVLKGSVLGMGLLVFLLIFTIIKLPLVSEKLFTPIGFMTFIALAIGEMFFNTWPIRNKDGSEESPAEA